MTRAVVLLATGCLLAPAQENLKLRDAMEWTVALRGRMAQMANPVVRVYGTASVAAAVCKEDRIQGSGLYRDAIASLHNVPQNAFTEKGTTILPVASFTGLWKYVVPAALKCDPNLAPEAANQRSKDRMELERRNANATLGRAWGLIDPSLVLDKTDNTDRAAQIANAAIDAADPDLFDIALLTRLLSQLRDRAPDLSDDLFTRSLDLVMSGPVPNPESLQELAKYLFTAPELLDKPDPDQASRNFQVSGVTVEYLNATRYSTNPDDIEALIDTTLKLLDVPAAVDRDPLAAYALALQLLPRARDLMPDRVDQLEAALANLQAQTSAAAQIQSTLGSAENPDPDSGDPAYRNFWLTGQIQNALGANRIDQARALIQSLTDAPARAQLSALVTYREAVGAIEAHSDQAIPLANLLRPGIKRSLLYIAIVASAKQLDAALQVLPLAARDIAPLPAEQRIRLQAALATALLRTDEQTAVSTLSLLVNAYNDAYVNPRRGRFDPRSARRIYNSSSDGNSDSSLILPGSHGLYEAVQTERGRRNFGLQAPGASSLNMASLLMAAGAVDPGRLEAAILGLRDENAKAGSLVKLGELRIRTAKAGKSQ